MNSSGIQVRRLREVTPGTLEGGAMTITPFATFKIGSAIEREQPGDVNSHRQASDNPATDLQTQGQGAADYRLGLHDTIREEVFGKVHTAAVSVTGADIVAEQTGNFLIKDDGAWGDLAAGDVVWITGLTQAPNGCAGLISSKDGDNLGFAWPTFTDEVPAGSVTVSHAGQLTLGTLLLTASYEEWNTKSSKGRKYLGVGASAWGLEVPFPRGCTQTFGFRAMLAAARLSAQLANTSTSSPSRKQVNSNVNFGDKGTTGSQMGFRYNGVLMPNLRVNNLKINVESPLQTLGGAGVLGPQDIALDSEFTVRLDLQVYRTGTDVDTLMDDAVNPDTEKSIGIGFKDGEGNRDYIWLARLQPTGGDPDGVKKQGAEMVDFSLLGRYDSVHSAIRYARLLRP